MVRHLIPITKLPCRAAAMATVASLLLATARADIDPRSQMLLGNPDGATTTASNRERYLIQRPRYALSYNDRLRFPNWVCGT